MAKTKFVFVFLTFVLLAQNGLQRNRITGKIDTARRVVLQGHIRPEVREGNDQGSVERTFVLPRVTLMLAPSASQKADLDQLLAQQQDPSSPNYHRWLTPEQYAERFGVGQDDLNQIVAWLQGQNLKILSVARARNSIAITGTAAAVENALGTEIHYYLVNGKRHFANATPPSIPAALQGMIAAIHGLNDFRMRPALRRRMSGHAVGASVRNAGSPGISGQPQYTTSDGSHYLGPGDIANIYNIKPLLNSGFTGSGQKLVVVGQTQIRLPDIEQFRTFFSLPVNDPLITLVPGETDPGIVSSDLGEAELDLEIAGAVAPNSTVYFVYSSDVVTSAQYAIDQNLAPILSMSYGDCEAAYSAADVSALEALAKQANAQGITWFAASGDSGALDCYGDGGGIDNAQSVDVPASLPEVTGIGGSEFNEGNGSYWSTSNAANNASAQSYIPETAWNDTAEDAGTCDTPICPSASGGGASKYFPKPSWQTGTGVPNDNARDVPDISVSASADHDGYLIYTSDPDTCGTSRRSVTVCTAVVGGTSVGPPIFAGLAALVNQSLVSRGVLATPGLGNINPMLYSLAQSSPAAFHDITTGDNIIIVTCTFFQRNCSPASVGFSAGAGYDLVTGLGSVDVDALHTAWIARIKSNNTTPQPTITGLANAASYTQTFAPGMLLTIFGSQLAPGIQSFSSVPLPANMQGVSVTIGGITAPLLYVSPGQLNVQIPYEAPVGSNVTLVVNNNGQSTSASLMLAAAAPGIFTDANGAPVPSTNGSRSQGQWLTLYITGFGAVSPAVADGAGLATQPAQTTTVSVGGLTAQTNYIGVPQGYAGVAQINYQIPPSAPLGPQPVVVTVGGISSKPATLIVRE